MKTKGIYIIGVVLLMLVGYGCRQTEQRVDEAVQVNYPNNRAPLLAKPYIELPIGAVHPRGWLQEQMKRMMMGMTGHLDSIYAHVMGARNGWLGGDGDVWERGPYWIDGLLPLAYIMNNQNLIDKVQPWIEWTLASQKPNGYFGPDTDRLYESGLQRDNARDWWPKMVMLKVMQQYYSATQDDRVIAFLTNYFKYQLAQLPKEPLGKWTFWGEQRGADNLMVVYWLYNLTGDKFLLELGDLIHKQTFDWTDIFLHQNHLRRQNSLHCVNLAQGFKAPVVYYQADKDTLRTAALKKAVADMRTTIGFPIGLWGGDELLRFGNPIQGSELCTAVEMMFSLETALEITGDVQWADHLERIAFNALPTQIDDDFMSRQYYQQINQVQITRQKRNFVTPHEDTDVLFGTLSGYPCCTSNLHQGWPKFTSHLWFASADAGLAALVYAPCEVTAYVADSIPVTIVEDTSYPFAEVVNFKLTTVNESKVAFPLHLRIPSWCHAARLSVNGQSLEQETPAGQITVVNREWGDGDVLTLELPAQIDVEYWYDGAASIVRGPLLYALKMNEKWTKKTFEPEKRAQYGDWYYEVTSDSPWNFALSGSALRRDQLQSAFVVKKSAQVANYPWTVADAPIVLTTQAKRVAEWLPFKGSAGAIPYYMQNLSGDAKEETIELIPYGCTTLRIAEFPLR